MSPCGLLGLISDDGAYLPKAPDPEADILSATEELNGYNLRVYPNPADDHIYISGNFPECSDAEFAIVNIMGETALEYRSSALSGDFAKRLDISRLPRGVYTIRINACGEIKFAKFMK